VFTSAQIDPLGGKAIRMAGPIILVVEDEPLILADIEAALLDGGYEVLCCGTADQAMLHLENADEAPAGLITDIRLPGEQLSGWDIAHRARELSPEIGVIYMSGDSGGDWASKGVPESTFIQKPFASAQVVTAISTALNSGGGSRHGSGLSDQ